MAECGVADFSVPSDVPELVLRTVLIVGTGLIGTSIGMALRRHGIQTYLEDEDPEVAQIAAGLGAGRAQSPDEPVDLAVIAVPPPLIGPVLFQKQRQGVALSFTDTASVKTQPHQDIEKLGCDLSDFVGGHPMGGRERSGPRAARADLFDGRPWVFTPSLATTTETLLRARRLATLCGAFPVGMDVAEHDQAVALVSHAPHLLASLMATQLVSADSSAVQVAGPGLRGVVRLAAGDAGLWLEILTANAGAIADVLDALGDDLQTTVRALRELAATQATTTDHLGGDRRTPSIAQCQSVLTDILRQGNTGHARLPGKHGAPPVRYATVPVVTADQPGQLARLFRDVGEADINIEDVSIEHVPGHPVGLVELMVQPGVADTLATELRQRSWTVYR